MMSNKLVSRQDFSCYVSEPALKRDKTKQMRTPLADSDHFIIIHPLALDRLLTYKLEIGFSKVDFSKARLQFLWVCHINVHLEINLYTCNIFVNFGITKKL